MNNQKEQEIAKPNTLVKSLLRTVYIVHLFLIALFSTYILAKYPDVPSVTITFIMIIIYGYMGVLLIVVNFLLVICKNHEKAVAINRIVAKAVIFIFPVFGLLSISKDEELHKPQIRLFIVYMGIVTLMLLIYEIVTCLCYQDEHPQFLFAKNNLQPANAAILEKRNQYNKMVSNL